MYLLIGIISLIVGIIIAVVWKRRIIKKHQRWFDQAVNDEFHRRSALRRQKLNEEETILCLDKVNAAKAANAMSDEYTEFIHLSSINGDRVDFLSNADYLWHRKRLKELTPKITALLIEQARGNNFEALERLTKLTRRSKSFDDSPYYQFTGEHFVTPPELVHLIAWLDVKQT